MKLNPFGNVRAGRLVLVVGSLAVIMTGFTNCSKGFESAQQASVDLSESSSALVIESPASNFATKSMLTIAGKCKTGSLVQIKGDVKFEAAANCVSGSFTKLIQLSTADGVKNVIISQVASSGIATLDSRNFIVDNAAPIVTLVNLSADSNVGKQLSLSGGCENGLPIKIAAGGISITAICNQDMYTAVFDLSNVTDGRIQLSVSQTDSVGLVGAQTVSIVKDTTAPNVAIISPANNADVTSPIQIIGTCETGVNVVIAGAGASTALTIPCISSAFSSPMNLTAGAGSRVISVTQTDLAGNTKTDTRTFQAKLVSVPALATSITAPASNTVAREGITLQGACSIGYPVQISGGGISSAINAVCVGGLYTQQIMFSNGDGSKLILVKQSDSSSNAGQDARSFIKDSNAPAISIAAPSANSAVRFNTVLTGACEIGLSVEISGSVTAGRVSCANGSFAANITFSGGDGQKSVTVSQTDLAGNVGSISRSFVLDSVAPNVTIASPSEGTESISELTVTGACESGLLVTAGGSGVKSPASKICAASAYSITFVLSDNDGTKEVEVAQIDAAGNAGKAQRLFKRSTPMPNIDGPALYAMNCAGCHSPLSNSSKLGRSAAQISGAISSVSSMISVPSVVALNAAQIAAIAQALSPTTVPQNPGPAGTCSPTAVRGISKEGVRRLNRSELIASLTAVWPNMNDVNIVLEDYPDPEQMEDVTKYEQLYSEAQTLQWAYVVDTLAQTVFDNGTVERIGGACLRAPAITDQCWTDFFRLYGRKVYRRPLASTEISRLIGYVKQQTSSSEAVKLAITVLFRSPDFLFHLELGSAEEAQRVRLTDHEVANRISFSVTGTPPDEILANAADRGELKSLAQVEAQAQRLMATPAAKAKVSAFYGDWLQLSHIKTPGYELLEWIYELSKTGLMDQRYRREIMDYVDYITFKKRGNFNDLLTSQIHFARADGMMEKGKGTGVFAVGSALAGIYGGTFDSKFANFTPELQTDAIPFAAPNNPGLLTRAGFMASGRLTSEPITRGVFLLRRILCNDLPTPDFSVINARLDEVGKLDPLVMANHQITSAKTSAASCMGCHSKINPAGYAFEAYDPVGRFRTKESVIDMNKFFEPTRGTVAQHNLPYPVSNVDVGDSIKTISSPLAMAEAIAGSKKAQLCMSAFALRSMDRRKESAGDSCGIEEAAQVLSSGRPLLDMFVKTVANQDIFWRRK